MATTVRRDGRVVNPALTKDTAIYYAHWTEFPAGDSIQSAIQIAINGTPVITSNGPSGVIGSGLGSSADWSATITVSPDTNYGWRARVISSQLGFVGSTFEAFKSYANVVTFGAASVIGTTQDTIEVSFVWTPNTNVSTATAFLQYKKASDSAWTTWATSSPVSGTSPQTFHDTITGLDNNTQYQFRVLVSRTTVNDTSATSSTLTAATSPGVPQITTDPASVVTSTSAVMNGTLIIGQGTAVFVHFEYGPTIGLGSSTASQPASASGTFSAALSGLTASSTFYYRAVVTFATPAGSPTNGTTVSFTTPGNPLAAAAQESHVDRVEYDRKYGKATTIPLSFRADSGTSSDRLITSASPFVAGDVKISKDGGAFANTTNLPTQITGGIGGYTLSLTAAEMQCMEAYILVVDQNGPAFRDLEILVRTELRLGAIDVDASSNTDKTAVLATGQGTGNGFQGIGGASGLDWAGVVGGVTLQNGTAQGGGAGYIDLVATANATDDYYNNAVVVILSGTGAGQSRVIADYTGSSKRATVDASWSTNPNATSKYVVIPSDRVWQQFRGELTALPSDSATYGEKMQLFFQRFAFKIDQTATVQQLYKADNSTVLASRSVSDSGGTQVIGKLS